MANGQLNGVIQHLRRAALLSEGARTDGELLECYLTLRDDTAFGALLPRHGPIVFVLFAEILSRERGEMVS